MDVPSLSHSDFYIVMTHSILNCCGGPDGVDIKTKRKSSIEQGRTLVLESL